MNWLDIAFLLVLGMSVVGGLVRGLVREIFGVIGLFAGFLLAVLLAPALAPHLDRWMVHPAAYAVAFVLIFFVTIAAAAIVASLLTKFVEALQLSCLNRIAGGLFGLVRGAVMIVVIFWGLLFFVPNPDRLMANSRLAPLAFKGAQWFSRILPGHPSPENDRMI